MLRKKRDVSADLDAALVEMAGDFRGTGLMSEDTYQKITMRQLRAEAAAPAPALTPAEIRALREDAHLSQAAFAHHLHVTPAFVSRLERGAQEPKGTTLVLLNAIRRLGAGPVLGC